MFLATSIPKTPIPDIKTQLFAYFLTASIPIAPIYLLHLSKTFSSLASNSFYYIFVYVTSTSSKLAIPSFTFFTFGYFLICVFKTLDPSRSAAEGGYILFNSSSNSFTASHNFL